MTYDQWKTTPPWDMGGYCCPKCGAVSDRSGPCEECLDEEEELEAEMEFYQWEPQ